MKNQSHRHAILKITGFVVCVFIIYFLPDFYASIHNHTIKGIVRTDSGQLLSGAEVNWLPKIPFKDTYSGMLIQSATFADSTKTNEKGTFSLRNISGVDNRLIVTAKGYATSIIPLSEEILHKGRIEITLNKGSNVRGETFDQNGRPYLNTDIELFNYPEKLLRYSTKTDEQGQFSFKNIPDDVYIAQAVEKRQDGKMIPVLVRKIKVSQNQETVVYLGNPPDTKGLPASIHGTVFDSNNEPLPNALLHLDSIQEHPATLLKITTTTNDQGQYNFYDIPDGDYRLTGWNAANPHKLMLRKIVIVARIPHEQNLYEKIPGVEILVTDKESGKTIESATIQILKNSFTRITSPFQNPESLLPQREGQMIYHPMTPGDVELSAYQKGYFCQEKNIQIPEVTTEPVIQTGIQLKPTKSRLFVNYIFPKKYRPGAMYGLMVIAGGINYPMQLEKVPDKEGCFEVLGFPEGNAGYFPKVINEKELKTFITYPKPMNITDGTTQTLRFELFEYDAVPFICKTADGEPVPGDMQIEVLGYPDSVRLPVDVSCDFGSTNLIGKYIPTGKHTIRIQSPGYKPVEKELYVDPRKILVKLEPIPIQLDKN